MTSQTLSMTIQSATRIQSQYVSTVAVLCAMLMMGPTQLGTLILTSSPRSFLTSMRRLLTTWLVTSLSSMETRPTLGVMGTKHTAAHRDEVKLEAGPHTILPSSTEKLLGGQISQDLKWNQHILEGDQSLVKQITSRINGLCLLSPRSSFQTRLMVANGIVISKLCYLIQLWGGCEEYLLKPLQVLQNRAARAVTGWGWFTPKRKLLRKCNWLSIKQLVYYQSVVLAHKIATTSSPFYLAAKMTTAHPRKTRQAASGCIRFGEQFSANQNPIQ